MNTSFPTVNARYSTDDAIPEDKETQGIALSILLLSFRSFVLCFVFRFSCFHFFVISFLFLFCG
jgi:hypothetical protein